MKVFKAHLHAFGQADNGPAFIVFFFYFLRLLSCSLYLYQKRTQLDRQKNRQTGQRRKPIKKRMSNSALDAVTVQIHFVQELYTTMLRDTVLHYRNRDYERHRYTCHRSTMPYMSYTCFAFVHSLNVCISYVLSQDRILNPLVYTYIPGGNGRETCSDRLMIDILDGLSYAGLCAFVIMLSAIGMVEKLFLLIMFIMKISPNRTKSALCIRIILRSHVRSDVDYGYLHATPIV